jgi:hypothetical protein
MPCRFRGDFPWDTIATPEEQTFLRSNRRVELNAFTAPQFIEWLERKLTDHLGSQRFIPADAILADAYRRALAVAGINRALEERRKAAIQTANSATIPQSLRRQLEEALRHSPRAWDKALYEIARRSLLSRDGDD